jgi:hypothetical protein
VVHGRRFVVAGLVECIDMATEIQTDEDLEMSEETIEELERQLKYEEMDRNLETGRKNYEAWKKRGSPLIEKNAEGLSGGGIIRGTRAQVRGRTFRGVF